ncbi:hypothetical protein V7O66_04790 [Methanolobus sp. ZRKC3]|uniref:hypothetical protein n=1 Tax=Methanolobus sp. ZRKC3 TaxID=3125786 RepID=UPI0032515168
MTFETPHITYLDKVISTNLSLAVWVTDNYTEKKPIGGIKVKIKDAQIKAIKNPSGYYCFNDLNPGSYIVNIDSDYYFQEEVKVEVPSISDSNRKNPVVEISMKPRPSYPFPKNSTLVRGLISNGDTVAAEVKIVDEIPETLADDRGEFVLYIKEAVKDKKINIQITKNQISKMVGTTTEGKSISIEEGKEIFVGVISFP